MVDVFTVGNATRDVILISKSFKAYPDKRFSTGYAEAFTFGSKVDVEEMIVAVGGGGINSATTFARQGFSVGLIGKIGDDCSGDDIVFHLKKENIRDDYIIREEGLVTAYSTVLLSPSGERTVLVYRGEAQQVHPNDVKLEDLISSWMYVTSLSGNTKLLASLLKHTNKHRIKVALNPGADEIRQKDFAKLLPQVDVLVLNREEAEKIVPKDKRKTKTIFDALGALTKAIIVVTDGRRGAVCSDGRRLYYVDAPDIEVVDRLGAGDAFGSGFVAGLIKSSGDIQHAMRVAVSNAASVCMHHGATTGIIHENQHLIELAVTEHTLRD